jgi:hypothetical protein
MKFENAFRVVSILVLVGLALAFVELLNQPFRIASSQGHIPSVYANPSVEDEVGSIDQINQINRGRFSPYQLDR